MPYGNRIRAARQLRGLSQFDLGLMIGRRDGDISRYERGDLAPKVKALADISVALGVPLDYLAGLTDEMRPDPKWRDPRKVSVEERLAELPAAPTAGTPPQRKPRPSRSR